MKTLYEVFCNDSIQSQVSAATQAFIKYHEDQLLFEKVRSMSSFLPAVDYSDNPKIIEAAAYYSAKERILSAGPEMHYDDLGPFDMVQGSMLINRQRYLKLLRADGYTDADFRSPTYNADRMEDWGMLTRSPTAALAVHAMWLCSGISRPYYGNVPLTKPVVKFFKVFFRNGSPSQAEGNRLTFKVADEIGKDPIYTNYAMWVMGRLM